MTSPRDLSFSAQLGIFRRFLLALYLGKRGYRAALITYGIGFWIFASGAMLIAFWQLDPPAVLLPVRVLLLHLGLFILVMMTFPIVRCAFDLDDETRPKSRFRRVMEPTVIAVFAPFYVMLIVASFIQFAAPVIFGSG